MTKITRSTKTPCNTMEETERLLCQTLTKQINMGFGIEKIKPNGAELRLHGFFMTVTVGDCTLEVVETTESNDTMEDLVTNCVHEGMTIMYIDTDSAELAEDETRVYLNR